MEGYYSLKKDSPKLRESSRLGITDEIINFDTHEIIVHQDYLVIFKALIKFVKKILVYKTKELYLDGQIVISKTPIMTEAFKQSLDKGEINASVSPYMD